MADFLVTYLADPREEDQHTTFLMQKYLLLHSQQETLQRRLSTASTISSPSSPSSPSSEALTFSPTEALSRTTSPSDGVSSPQGEPSVENGQLRVVNHQLKATLTELLNSDTAKHETSFRMWVQSRLMDAEMELKRQRRRMSSVTIESVDNFMHGIQHSHSSPV